jgi:hypothetical protein
MRAYYDLLRAIVAPRGPVPAPRLGDPMTYASLVRAQHHQPLEGVFEALRHHVGKTRFDEWVTTFRAAHPPREALPSRWIRPFADWLIAQPEVDTASRELADFIALRVEVSIAPDHPSARPLGVLRGYAHDPRMTARGQQGGACTLLVFRLDDAQVRVLDLDADGVAAWGLACGETTREALAALGIDDIRIERGRARLRLARIEVMTETVV